MIPKKLDPSPREEEKKIASLTGIVLSTWQFLVKPKSFARFMKDDQKLLESYLDELKKRTTSEEKVSYWEGVESVASQLLISHYRTLYDSLKQIGHKQMFLTLLALDAGALFFDPARKTKPLQELENLLSHFFEVEQFYEEIGGLLGYVELVRELLVSPKKNEGECRTPQSESIEGEETFVKHASTFGLAHLDRSAFVVAAAGLGERLGLIDAEGAPLPVAHLPFMGRSLLAELIRDLEGLESLYYKTYGRKIIIPLALMTSKEQGNEKNLRALFEENQFFGRPLSSIRLFSQLSVPVMTIKGTFAANGPAQFLFHPAGHGALWKSAEEAGIFRWLQEQRIEHLLLRQINNPLAGLNHNLLAFLGLAIKKRKGFGFLACERMTGAAEGALVDHHNRGEHYITNVEYHQLHHQKMVEGLANTNILYARLQELSSKLEGHELFGPIVNMKSEVPSYLPNGRIEKVKGGRLESMMQNISEKFTAKEGDPLPTIIVKHSREKVIAAIKRLYDPKMTPLETPEAAHYAILKNNYSLLQRCTSEPLPAFSSLERYLVEPPTLLFTYHPILGPLYEVIQKKVHCRRVVVGSELELEIGELFCKELELVGSLRIMGVEGRCQLEQVQVINRGVDWKRSKELWKGALARHESCQIILGEGAELIAENLILSGDLKIEVPAGQRMIVHQTPEGSLFFEQSALTNFLDRKENPYK